MIACDETGNCGHCGGPLNVELEMLPESTVACITCGAHHGSWGDFQAKAIWHETQTGDERQADAVAQMVHRAYAKRAVGKKDVPFAGH